MTPAQDITAVLERVERACSDESADHAGDAQDGLERGERVDLWEPPEVTLLLWDAIALTQYVRTHLSGGGVEERPTGAGWSTPPTEEAAHPERLSADELRLTGNALSEWAWEHLARGYGVSLTVREVSRLIAGVKAETEAALSASNREEPICNAASVAKDIGAGKLPEPKASGVSEGVRAALEFYADPGTYHAIMFLGDPPCGEFVDDFSADHGDPDYDREMPGRRARAALALLSDQTPKGEEIASAPVPPGGWRPMSEVPRDGTEVVFINKFGHCSDVVHWRDEYFKGGLRFDGRFENRSGQSTGMNDDIAWEAWALSPLPSPPIGEGG